MPSYVKTKKDSKNREYFAAMDTDECVARCAEKIDQYFSEMTRTGRINLYRNSYFKFFQGFILKGAIYQSGSLGELSNTYVNHYGNLITHSVNLVTQQKLSYEPQATVDDSQAADQIKLAKGILYLYANRSDTDLDGKLRLATETMKVFGESYVSVLWNKNLGRTIAGEFDQENGVVSEIREGDNEFEVWTPFDVIVDTTLPGAEKKKWLILRRWENKFDVAARYPDWADEIKAVTCSGHIGDTQLTYSISDVSDIIPVYYLFHDKSPAVPQGRVVIFVDTNIICADGKLTYRNIPLFRAATRELWGSPYGYSDAFDILPLQESVDRLCSSILTNQITFATQNILLAKGSEISWEDLYGGLNVIEWPAEMGEAGKPSALQLTSTPKEVFDFVNMNVGWMGTLMGITDALKGNADLVIKGQASGDALAILTTNSIQFNSATQKAYVRLAEQVGTAIIHNLQDFAFPDKTMQRQGMSMSATKKYFRRKFGQGDIDKIDKIVVRYGNPFTQTTAGRLQTAGSLMQQGKISPDQYFEVLETGNLEPALSAEEAQLQLIKEENEALMRGENVEALWSDNHVLHIQEHLAEIANLEARRNIKALQAFQKHVQEGHVQQLKQLDPVLAALMKQPVINAPAPAAPPRPAPAGAPNPQPVPAKAPVAA